MNLIFDDVSDMLKHFFTGDVSFKEKADMAFVINGLCDYQFEESLLYEELRGSGYADDIDSWFFEILADGYDWSSVLFHDFDLRSLTTDIRQLGDLGTTYTWEETMELLGVTLSSWSEKARTHVLNHFSKP